MKQPSHLCPRSDPWCGPRASIQSHKCAIESMTFSHYLTLDPVAPQRHYYAMVSHLNLSKVPSSDLASELARRRRNTKEIPSTAKQSAARANLLKARQAKADKASAKAMAALVTQDT